MVDRGGRLSHKILGAETKNKHSMTIQKRLIIAEAKRGQARRD